MILTKSVDYAGILIFKCPHEQVSLNSEDISSHHYSFTNDAYVVHTHRFFQHGSNKVTTTWLAINLTLAGQFKP